MKLKSIAMCTSAPAILAGVLSFIGSGDFIRAFTCALFIFVTLLVFCAVLNYVVCGILRGVRNGICKR
jgi:uncharacterized membrane protein YgaE (UPF0421/DUF939 family)